MTALTSVPMRMSRIPDLEPESVGRGGDASPLHVVMRYKWGIIAFAILMTAVASVFISRMPVIYSATSSVMIDARQVRVITAENLLSSQMLDTELLRTEMEGLQSFKLATAVVEKLGLNTVPEYCGTRPPAGPWTLSGLLGRLTGHAPVDVPAPACDVSVDAAARHLLGMVSATNDGKSYIIHLSADSTSPALAAAIANAYADAFVAERKAEREAVSRNASAWLTTYVAQLREQAVAADTAAADYRKQQHLASLGGGTLVSRTLTGLNDQLTSVTSEIAQRKAALDQLQPLQHGVGDVSASPVVMSSPLVQSLMLQESQLLDNEAQLRSRLGDAHPQVRAAAAQVARIRSEIRVQVNKTVAGLGSEVAAMTARQSALAAQVSALQNQLGVQGQADVRMQELQRDADSGRQLYQSMLTRLKEIDAEQGMQQADARVVVDAIPPDGPSYPHKRMMLVGAFLASLGLGGCLAFVAGMLSRVFRDADHVEGETGLRVLGLFPKPVRRGLPQRMAIDQPGSVEAEALHSILANLAMAPADDGAGGRVILLTSALPGEGKTSFAVALGRSAARSGISTVLLDCDLRRPAVRRMLESSAADHAASAVVPAEGHDAELARQSFIDPESGLHVLPLIPGIAGPHQLLASQSLRRVLHLLRSRYDLVLLDTPPVLVVADAVMLSPLADGCVLLIDRRSSPRRAVASALQALRRSGAHLAGVVLSKVEIRHHAPAGSAYREAAKAYFGVAGAPGD